VAINCSLIRPYDPLSSPSMIMQLYTTIDIALPTRSQPHPCSSQVWLITASHHIGLHRTTSDHVWPCLQTRDCNFKS